MIWFFFASILFLWDLPHSLGLILLFAVKLVMNLQQLLIRRYLIEIELFLIWFYRCDRSSNVCLWILLFYFDNNYPLHSSLPKYSQQSFLSPPTLVMADDHFAYSGRLLAHFTNYLCECMEHFRWYRSMRGFETCWASSILEHWEGRMLCHYKYAYETIILNWFNKIKIFI